MNKISFFSFIVSFVLASSAFADLNKLTIPVVANKEQTPIIDGSFSPSEWRYATMLKGFVGKDTKKTSQRQVSVYFVADETSLYIGMVSPHVPKRTLPEGKLLKRDKISFQSDRVEIKIIPPNPQKHGMFYFIGNSKNSIYDEKVDPKTNKTMISWNGNWRFKNSVDKNNWYMELKIDFKEFGINKVSSSQKWKLNFSRAWIFPFQYTGLKRMPHDSFDVTFIQGAPAVQIETLGSLPKGNLDLSISAREYEGNINVPKEASFDNTPLESDTTRLKSNGKKVKVSCKIEDAKGKIIFNKTQKILLVPGRKQYATFKKVFPAKNGDILVLKIFDPLSKELYYESKLPFTKYNPKEEKYYQCRLTHGTILNSWRLKTAFFPYWEKAKIGADFFDGSLKDNAVLIKAIISSNKGFRKNIEIPVKNGKCNFKEVKISSFPEGTYKIVAEVIDNNNKVISKKETSYKRKVFIWEHNSLGKTRRVIKPWTAIKILDGNKIVMWGRSYKLSSLGLPVSIISQGKEILAKPIVIRIKTSKGVFNVTPTGSLKIIENAEDRVRWIGFGKLNKLLNVKIDGVVEYDGFMYFNISFSPQQPLKIKHMDVIVPIKKETAQLMHFQGTDSRSNFSGAIPSGSGVVYDSLKQRSHLPGGFVPHIWIGNPARGISWFANSDKGWVSVPQKPAIEIVRSDNVVNIKLNVINKKFNLRKTRTIEMGLMGTPVKPLMPIKNIKTRAVNWVLGNKNKVIQDHMYAPYPPDFDYKALEKGLKEQAIIWKCDALKLYFNKIEIGAALPEWKVFRNEWGGMEPIKPYPASINRFGYEKSLTVQASLTDSKIDMHVYYIAQLAKKTSMAGTYWDITGIYQGLPMLENGTAYINDEGKLVRTFDLLYSRKLFKRVATMWQDIRGEPNYMEIHSTNHIGIPFYSFAHSLLNFEWLWPNKRFLRKDGKWKDFIDLRPLDLFATEGVPSQFGFWVQSINHGQRPKDPKEKRRIQRSALALGGLHNHFTGPRTIIGKRDELEFIGYWDEKNRIATNDDKFKASMWHKGQNIEIIAVNLSLVDLTEIVIIDLKQTGINTIEKIFDIETGQSILPDKLKINNGKAYIKLNISSHNFKLIKIQGK